MEVSNSFHKANMQLKKIKWISMKEAHWLNIRIMIIKLWFINQPKILNMLYLNHTRMRNTEWLKRSTSAISVNKSTTRWSLLWSLSPVMYVMRVSLRSLKKVHLRYKGSFNRHRKMSMKRREGWMNNIGLCSIMGKTTAEVQWIG